MSCFCLLCNSDLTKKWLCCMYYVVVRSNVMYSLGFHSSNRPLERQTDVWRISEERPAGDSYSSIWRCFSKKWIKVAQYYCNLTFRVLSICHSNLGCYVVVIRHFFVYMNCQKKKLQMKDRLVHIYLGDLNIFFQIF